MGVAFIKGLQGEGRYLKAAACAKHFAAHSGPEALRHEFNAIVSKKDLEETYLPAFEACVKEADVESIMGAYNRVNGSLPAAATRCCRRSSGKNGDSRAMWSLTAAPLRIFTRIIKSPRR